MQFAKKKFGQNFITDKNLINKIVGLLDQDENQLIIEVGPGRGALTKELVKRFKKVIAIEIDKDMEQVLSTSVDVNNFELLIEDVLEVDFKKLIDKQNFQKVAIISNTPYYITTELLFKTFDSSKLLNQAIFMTQKEVALRICAKENENNYNNLSVAARFYSDVKYEFTVKKNMFSPTPKVDSAIIKLTFNQLNLEKVRDDKYFISFVRKLFNNKRKTILNNLGNAIEDKNKAKTLLDSLAIDYRQRPENLSLEHFINLYNEVHYDGY
ncbi:16S rRNA (adenine(1518)-N(6)/adenine(1519)-N(6))-dimethyltransferase RsmA [Spiroplasma apis]|uniref:Ribosomal RNA small subunit methyltransferase A n=1 Tax=Spiroplasma apis B31 TaxID=1276258 RepID=V5RJF1_SPIAP|nr:16S rRNA (adenine(1518)-N(6)/adenine(1519)-N(6))-dimethyltransferase RsmA [Spiroplasma apis]AHB36832.1 dimethyladenosine transferase [Spiroplasma apis B31]